MDTTNQEKATDFTIPKKEKKVSGGTGTIIVFAIFVIFALGVIVFLYNQNQTLKEKLTTYEANPTPAAVTTPSPTPTEELPKISNLLPGSKITSPLKVTGTIPSSWMFEGIFPIKLLDEAENVIAQTSAKEATPGSWMKEGLVEFTATLTFKASTGSGTLVIQNDNASGLSENDKSFEVPVAF